MSPQSTKIPDRPNLKPAVTTRERGLAAEARAVAWLEGQGCAIVERNYRWRGGEIDVIARDGAALVFVEVRSAAAASPWLRHTITAAKRARLRRTIALYLGRELSRAPGARPTAVRFDLLWLEGAQVEHWKNVELG